MKVFCSMLHRGASGFSLIEALISVVVLAIGLLALGALQGALIRSGADAKARSLLAAYMQSELDRVRLGGVAAASSGVRDSASIADPADPLRQVTETAGLGSVVQTTTVTQFVYNAASGNFEQSGVDPESGQPHLKRVEIDLSWSDATGGAARSLRMSTAISPVALTSSTILIEREPSDDAGLGPIVRRRSPAEEGMIPIAWGDGQETAATTPKPELVGQQQTTLVADTRFDVLTYDSNDALGADDFARFNRRIETALVGCTCQMNLDGFPTGGSNPPINVVLRQLDFRPAYWSGERYTVPEASGAPAASPVLNASQSQLCDVCCRDHHDPSPGTGVLFGPWDSAGHVHFDAAGSPVSSGGTYREACRLIRVDGLWRVTPDPRMDDLALAATRQFPETTGGSVAPADNDRATSPLLSIQGRSAYLDFAYSAIKTLFYDRAPFDREAAQEASGLNQPAYVPVKAGDRRWLHARGLLRDHLEPEAVQRLQKAVDDCTGTGVTAQAQCVVRYSPVAVANVTELAVWAGKETSETGQVAPEMLTTNFAQASQGRYPSAFALVSPISVFDGTGPLLDEQLFVLAAGTVEEVQWLNVASPSGVLFGDPLNPVRGFASVAGGFRFNGRWNGVATTTDSSKANDPQLEVGLNSSAPCTPGQANNNSNPYSCTAAVATDVDLVMGGYNYLEERSGNLGNPCPGGVGNIGQGQALCRVHTLQSITVDGAPVTPLNAQLVGGTAGTPSEKLGVVLPAINEAAVSEVVLDFTLSTSNATPRCIGAAFVGWTCE